jgi:hypothetical protein
MNTKKKFGNLDSLFDSAPSQATIEPAESTPNLPRQKEQDLQVHDSKEPAQKQIKTTPAPISIPEPELKIKSHQKIEQEPETTQIQQYSEPTAPIKRAKGRPKTLPEGVSINPNTMRASVLVNVEPWELFLDIAHHERKTITSILNHLLEEFNTRYVSAKSRPPKREKSKKDDQFVANLFTKN